MCDWVTILPVVSFFFQGMNHFYSDQPELSLRFYRRLLQMGIGDTHISIISIVLYFIDLLSQDFSDIASPAINCFFKCSPLPGSAELYNNLGLCCFFAQQYDMTLTCFQVAPNSNCRTSNQTKATNARLIQTFPLQRALATAEDETLAEVDAVSTIF